MRKLFLLIAASLGTAATGAEASETVTYTYDARGRLVKVERSGTVNNGVTTAYVLDRADNRVTKTTSGSANPGPP
jgi:uncharacterized protein RhaS with RHS repeats